MHPSLRKFTERLTPKVPRSIHQFSQEEVRLPKGPRKGLYFDLDYAPFNKFIFDAIADPYWRKVSVVGPTQNGKTLVATNIPLLYFLFEEEEDVIFGIPSMDLASGMWIEKLRPVIEDSKYRDLLPTTGAGSKGGSFTAVQFKNGVNLRFMGAGGSAEQMSSHTAKNIILTEVDKMDKSSGDGAEADPVSLIQMRADSFEESNIIMECTVSTTDGRIWQEAVIQGSCGDIYVPCPYCHEYQTLVRDGLVFDDTDQIVAEKTARYECAHCHAMWDNNDRLEALQTPVLAHRGQTVVNGKAMGELPPTRNFGLRYNVLHSPMQSLGKTASQEWEAKMSDLKEKKKAMTQSKWAIPYVDEDINRDQLTKQILRSLADKSYYKLGEIPEWVDCLTFATDIQKGYCFYQCEGYNLTTMRSIVIEYGTVDQRQDNEVGLLNMLSEVDQMTREGWSNSNGDMMFPEVKLVDCGYEYHVIAKWLPTHPDWFGIKGIGTDQRNKLTGGKEIYKIDGILNVRVQKNGQKLWFIEVDQTKAMVHDRYLLPTEEMDYFRFVPNDVDITWINSMTAEVREYDPLGETFTWKKLRKRNDYLDVSSYNVAGSYILREKAKRRSNKNEQVQQKVTKEYQREQSGTKSAERGRHHGKWFSGERSLWGPR